MFPVHVVEEAKAIGGRVVDAVRVFGCDVEKGAYKPCLIAFFTWPGCLNIHVETLKKQRCIFKMGKKFKQAKKEERF